jgi:hypothetical protein
LGRFPPILVPEPPATMIAYFRMNTNVSEINI